MRSLHSLLLNRPLGGAALLAATLLAWSSLPSGCDPAETKVEEPPPPTCAEQGGIEVDGGPDSGECVATCDPATCTTGNTCLGNECRLLCDDHDDCLVDGTQHCAEAVADDGTKANFCLPHGLPSGYSDPATSTWGGWFGTPCPKTTECDKEGGFVCLGVKDDPDSYCTKLDCKADADCPGGYECTLIRDTRAICGVAVADKIYMAAATATNPCIDPADFEADGKTYQEGPGGLLRNACVKRAECSPCATDLDCSRGFDTACTTDAQGNAVCAKGCTVGDDMTCPREYECVDRTADGKGGRCIPRFGTCAGEGNFCEPCRNDLDCGTSSSKVWCMTMQLSKEKACFDQSFTASCPGGSDAECPESPSGANGYCLQAGDLQGGTADPLYHKCYVPRNLNPQYFSCWP